MSHGALVRISAHMSIEDELNSFRGWAGYTLHGLQEKASGMIAHLTLAGPACNAFGHDVANLTLDVSYDTTSRRVYDVPSCRFRRLC